MQDKIIVGQLNEWVVILVHLGGVKLMCTEIIELSCFVFKQNYDQPCLIKMLLMINMMINS